MPWVSQCALAGLHGSEETGRAFNGAGKNWYTRLGCLDKKTQKHVQELFAACLDLSVAVVVCGLKSLFCAAFCVSFGVFGLQVVFAAVYISADYRYDAQVKLKASL